MDNEQLYEAGRTALNMLAALHQQEDAERIGLGAWILAHYYPGVTDSILAGCDDENQVRPLMLTRWVTGRLDFMRVAHFTADPQVQRGAPSSVDANLQ
jgi:hypothetical protein